MRITVPLRLILCLSAILLFDPFASNSTGQTCNSSNTVTVDKKGWIQGTEIPVYIDPAIIDPRRQAIIDSFTNWQTANTNPSATGNNSRVTLALRLRHLQAELGL